MWEWEAGTKNSIRKFDKPGGDGGTNANGAKSAVMGDTSYFDRLF
ncbi:predicted protein [Sclerotinia sclerotiorum 1980 UF-70]|uniref:Uncharacterized protein n=1 Tax=Sclerotinia sclerotiorum (strain ATCC 18683 / 1980 / Ss-1) TaxID=665079 RepID=A7E6W6_SCLS1|nr:predicted protein [Sclerotinia sclerotiorum 1980 UF-70]EDN91638.1 predicted protein [Sclerotinia sclerotiorum 1980 UF-70]